jgi:hypothetical protein
MPLLAVNAGKTEYRRRPHFRHKAGDEHESCLIGVARAVILGALPDLGYVTLPGHARDVRITGLSGHVYEAWCEVPPERVKIAGTSIIDKTTATVRLDDGREFRVLLVGGQDSGGAQGPTVEIVVSDPLLATLSPQELLNRMRLDVSEGNWCTHWKDDELVANAQKAAIDLAADAIDYGSQNRESALHKAAKEILERARCIAVPELRLATARLVRPQAVLNLEDVSLEKSLGEIRPDVRARTIEHPHWPVQDLLIEVTVTNTINGEREAKIKNRNLPALEIDLSMLAGRVSMAEFHNLVVNELAGKRWIHHPALAEAERSVVRAQEESRRAISTTEPAQAFDAGEPRKSDPVRPANTGGALPVSNVGPRSGVPPAVKVVNRALDPALQKVAENRLASQPFFMVPDLTAPRRSVPGTSSPYPQVIRSARVLKIRGIAVVSSSSDAHPAFRLQTIAAQDWPADTIFVELATTGLPDPGRLTHIRDRGQPTLVVDVSGIHDDALDESELTRLVFNELAAKRWVFHPSIDEYVRRFDVAQHSRQTTVPSTRSEYRRLK